MINKQEVIEKIKRRIDYFSSERDYDRGYRAALNSTLLFFRELDEPVKPPEPAPWEPEKPVVPQFIDTWIQGAKYNGFDLYEAMTDETPDKTTTWIVCNPETFAKAWIYGYEVEKEKLYTVKFSNEDFGKTYVGIIKTANKIGISTVPMNDECSKCYFTKSELEEFKFWNNPAFEIEEVEK
jgi:hypothetical protein